MLRSRHAALPLVLATAATVALVGCSSSGGDTVAGSGSRAAASSTAPSKPADAATFVSDSLDAFLQAKSAHVSGTFTDSSDGGSPISVDISYGDQVAIGTLTVSGNAIEISKPSDGKTYFKAGADFWTSSGAPAAAVTTLADKYVEVTADTQGFSDFASLLDRQKFVDGVKPSDSDLEGAKVTGPIDINGVSCFSIADSNGQGAYYAAASGDPYPVQLVSEGDGKLDFDGYDKTVDVPTPPAADVVQLPTS